MSRRSNRLALCTFCTCKQTAGHCPAAFLMILNGFLIGFVCAFAQQLPLDLVSVLIPYFVRLYLVPFSGLDCCLSCAGCQLFIEHFLDTGWCLQRPHHFAFQVDGCSVTQIHAIDFYRDFSVGIRRNDIDRPLRVVKELKVQSRPVHRGIHAFFHIL